MIGDQRCEPPGIAYTGIGGSKNATRLHWLPQVAHEPARA